MVWCCQCREGVQNCNSFDHGLLHTHPILLSDDWSITFILEKLALNTYSYKQNYTTPLYIRLIVKTHIILILWGLNNFDWNYMAMQIKYCKWSYIYPCPWPCGDIFQSGCRLQSWDGLALRFALQCDSHNECWLSLQPLLSISLRKYYNNCTYLLLLNVALELLCNVTKLTR